MNVSRQIQPGLVFGAFLLDLSDYQVRVRGSKAIGWSGKVGVAV